MSARAAFVALIALVSMSGGCDGYADLPLPLREFAPLRVERADRFSEGPGLAQIALDVPSDALGPFVVVGHPTAISDGAAVQSWAFGSCRGSPLPSNPGDVALRLCLAVAYVRGGSNPPPLAIAIVVESRADARRFTLSGVASEASP